MQVYCSNLSRTGDSSLPLSAFKTFNKAIQRIGLLYEFTVHSYQGMYDEGRGRLKQATAKKKNEKVAISLEGRKVSRSLKVMTFHAKDVYPPLLRSTLLIRLVATYEAFVIDSIRELAERTDRPFASKQILELPQDHLLQLRREDRLLDYIVNKTTRGLTSGGFKHIQKFYKTLGIGLVPASSTAEEMEEIHQRRHLYVHRAGQADAAYCRTFPATKALENRTVPVDETYLFRALHVFSASAAQVNKALLAQFPIAEWIYKSGSQKLDGSQDFVMLISGVATTEAVAQSLYDFKDQFQDGSTFEIVTIWIGIRGREFNWLVGTDNKRVTAFSKLVHHKQEIGLISQVRNSKIRR
jgi:hypothetical protein